MSKMYSVIGAVYVAHC